MPISTPLAVDAAPDGGSVLPVEPGVVVAVVAPVAVVTVAPVSRVVDVVRRRRPWSWWEPSDCSSDE